MLTATLSCGAQQLDPPRHEPPKDRIVAVGDGDQTAGYFGPSGGELWLAESGPVVFVPLDPTRHDGTALALKKDASVADAGSKLLGGAFRLSAVLEPPSRTFIEVWSQSLEALPAPCTADNVELAVLVDQQVGTSPPLSWTYEKARWADGRVKAQLPKLSPNPLQFVCARGTSGGGS